MPRYGGARIASSGAIAISKPRFDDCRRKHDLGNRAHGEDNFMMERDNQLPLVCRGLRVQRAHSHATVIAHQTSEPKEPALACRAAASRHPIPRGDLDDSMRARMRAAVFLSSRRTPGDRQIPRWTTRPASHIGKPPQASVATRHRLDDGFAPERGSVSTEIPPLTSTLARCDRRAQIAEWLSARNVINNVELRYVSVDDVVGKATVHISASVPRHDDAFFIQHCKRTALAVGAHDSVHPRAAPEQHSLAPCANSVRRPLDTGGIGMRPK